MICVFEFNHDLWSGGQWRRSHRDFFPLAEWSISAAPTQPIHSKVWTSSSTPTRELVCCEGRRSLHQFTNSDKGSYSPDAGLVDTCRARHTRESVRCLAPSSRRRCGKSPPPPPPDAHDGGGQSPVLGFEAHPRTPTGWMCHLVAGPFSFVPKQTEERGWVAASERSALVVNRREFKLDELRLAVCCLKTTQRPSSFFFFIALMWLKINQISPTFCVWKKERSKSDCNYKVWQWNVHEINPEVETSDLLWVFS